MIKSIIMIAILIVGLFFTNLYCEEKVIKKNLFYIFFLWLMSSMFDLVLGIMVDLMNDGQIFIDAVIFGYINSCVAIFTIMLELVSVYFIYLALKSQEKVKIDADLP